MLFCFCVGKIGQLHIYDKSCVVLLDPPPIVFVWAKTKVSQLFVINPVLCC